MEQWSLHDWELTYSASDRKGSNFESYVWRAVWSYSSQHSQRGLFGSSDRALDAYMCMQSLNVAARPEHTMWIKAATSRTYQDQQGIVKKSDIFQLFWDWWGINIRSGAFCLIIPIFLELCLVDYFMHTLFMQITSNLFDCNFMLPLHHQCQLLLEQHLRMDLPDLWVLSWNLRRQWQSVVLELIEILCDVHLMSCDGFVHFQIH